MSRGHKPEEKNRDPFTIRCPFLPQIRYAPLHVPRSILWRLLRILRNCCLTLKPSCRSLGNRDANRPITRRVQPSSRQLWKVDAQFDKTHSREGFAGEHTVRPLGRGEICFFSLWLGECHLLGVGFIYRTRVNVANSPKCPVGSLSEENRITEEDKEEKTRGKRF